uniref:Phorbol-ester/DAG-type domain-containing protein n=1 Tax=Macrostomum lignano TaxID=282301 RepID=A0A1I8JR80_9PLAT
MQDVPHRRAISAALEQLLAGYRDWPEADKAGTEWRLGHPDSPAGHRMRLASFAGHQTECAACGLRLLGIYQQGLQCTVCGRVAHRHCARFHRGGQPVLKVTNPADHRAAYGAVHRVAAGEQQLPDESFRRKLDNYADSTNVYDSLAHSDQPALSDAPDSMAPEAASHLWSGESLTYPGDLLQFYRFRRTAADVEALRADFGCGVGPAAFNKLDGKLAAQLLKLWLQELPTSLLPCQHYDKFVRPHGPACQPSCNQQAVELRRLLVGGPRPSSATLQHRHVPLWQIFRRVRKPPPSVFHFVVARFRPAAAPSAWSRVTAGWWPASTVGLVLWPLHDVAKGVLSHGRLGCVLPSFLGLTKPSQQSRGTNGGDISKSEVQAVLANRPDGSFLATGDRVTYGFSAAAHRVLVHGSP